MHVVGNVLKFSSHRTRATRRAPVLPTIIALGATASGAPLNMVVNQVVARYGARRCAKVGPDRSRKGIVVHPARTIRSTSGTPAPRDRHAKGRIRDGQTTQAAMVKRHRTATPRSGTARRGALDGHKRRARRARQRPRPPPVRSTDSKDRASRHDRSDAPGTASTSRTPRCRSGRYCRPARRAGRAPLARDQTRRDRSDRAAPGNARSPGP